MWNLKSNRKLPQMPWTVSLNDQLIKIVKKIDVVLKELNVVFEDQANQLRKITIEHEESMNELKFDIQRITHENQRLRRNIEQHDNIVANLLGENEDVNLRLSECLKTMRENKNDSNVVMCECCCESYEETIMLKCTNNHHICKLCVNGQCKSLNKKLDQTKNYLKCCSIHECNGQILESQLYQTEEGQTYINNYNFQKFIPVLYDYLGKFNREQIDRNLMFLKSDGSFRALQCRECNYGPILYEFCGDLEAHHGQEIAKNVFINNSCPKCNVFHENIDDFLPWNGYS
tara:strand:+ start:246 stop:1109 length:864 start_codon:yes stop_codon:yes gene_type:complete